MDRILFRPGENGGAGGADRDGRVKKPDVPVSAFDARRDFAIANEPADYRWNAIGLTMILLQRASADTLERDAARDDATGVHVLHRPFLQRASPRLVLEFAFIILPAASSGLQPLEQLLWTQLRICGRS